MKRDDPRGMLPDAVAEAARSYHAPPEPPREAMWRVIQARRRRRVPSTNGIRPASARVWPVPAALAAAAALAFLIAVPLTGPERGRGAGDGGGATDVGAAVPPQGDVVALDLEVWDLLERAETFLALTRADLTAGAADASTIRRARELLLDTRMLLDLTGSGDAGIHDLLSRMELVLVQVAHLEANPDEAELAAIAIEASDLLPRLHAVVDFGLTGGI